MKKNTNKIQEISQPQKKFKKKQIQKKRNRSAASKVFFPMRRRIPTWWPHLLTRPPLPTAEQPGQPIYTNTHTNINTWFGSIFVASFEKFTFHTLDPKELNFVSREQKQRKDQQKKRIISGEGVSLWEEKDIFYMTDVYIYVHIYTYYQYIMHI